MLCTTHDELRRCLFLLIVINHEICLIKISCFLIYTRAALPDDCKFQIIQFGLTICDFVSFLAVLFLLIFSADSTQTRAHTDWLWWDLGNFS